MEKNIHQIIDEIFLKKEDKILQNKNNENLLKTTEIAEYLKNKGMIEDTSDFKKELEKYMKENKNPENEVDRWIKVLNNLIDWANNENNGMEE